MRFPFGRRAKRDMDVTASLVPHTTRVLFTVKKKNGFKRVYESTIKDVDMRDIELVGKSEHGAVFYNYNRLFIITDRGGCYTTDVVGGCHYTYVNGFLIWTCDLQRYLTYIGFYGFGPAYELWLPFNYDIHSIQSIRYEIIVTGPNQDTTTAVIESDHATCKCLLSRSDP
ncbi:MAG: hypothetical protein CMK92_01940, partial [Pseudomonas sp.]|nr:hypothetical protein [Pseudomonas sp.]